MSDALGAGTTWLLTVTHLDPLALLGVLVLWLGVLTADRVRGRGRGR